jgi:hypothetical protein
LHTSIEAEASAVGVGWALGAGGTSKSAQASMQQPKVNSQFAMLIRKQRIMARALCHENTMCPSLPQADAHVLVNDKHIHY